MWLAIALLLVYAFALGVATPLAARRHRIPSGIASTRFRGPVVSARATLQLPAVSRAKVSASGGICETVTVRGARHARSDDVHVVCSLLLSAARRL